MRTALARKRQDSLHLLRLGSLSASYFGCAFSILLRHGRQASIPVNPREDAKGGGYYPSSVLLASVYGLVLTYSVTLG